MSHEGHEHRGHQHGDEDPFSTEEGAAFWAQWAPILETGTLAVSEALLDAAHVGAGTRVLDLACGLGHTTVAAAARGAEATGLDLNQHMLRQAAIAPGVRYVEGDMTRPPVGPWDAIVSRFGAHHADPSWVLGATKTLAPGGTLAIAEWATDTALFDVAGDMEFPTEDTAQEWMERFKAAGLRDIIASEVSFTIDFGDEETFEQFLVDMDDGAQSNVGAPGGQQENRAFIVSGRQ